MGVCENKILSISHIFNPEPHEESPLTIIIQAVSDLKLSKRPFSFVFLFNYQQVHSHSRAHTDSKHTKSAHNLHAVFTHSCINYYCIFVKLKDMWMLSLSSSSTKPSSLNLTKVKYKVLHFDITSTVLEERTDNQHKTVHNSHLITAVWTKIKFIINQLLMKTILLVVPNGWTHLCQDVW